MGQQNSMWSLVGVATQGFFNLFLDIFLIGVLGWGLRGAAWATVVAQYLAMGVMLWSIGRGGARVKLKWKVQTDRILSTFKAMAGLAGPLGFASAMKNWCYVLIAQAASCLSTVWVAAHHALFSLWNLCAYSNGPNQSAALAFIPTAKSKWEEKQIVQLIQIIGFLNGFINGIICFVIPVFIPFVFTPDILVWPLLKQIAPLAAFSLIIAGVEVGYQGILLAKQQVKNIVFTYIVTTLVTVFYFVYGLQIWGSNLFRVWLGLTLFFTARIVSNRLRLQQIM
eukprot:TRINITY_DN12719_c0_g1_i4.p1 TRINITY_DN12719_c0_g1~~TRINITY_DN12719_c0_g1_i4.p1  ORF type:complete len:281 (-),score=27.92 TRINITY_DN12719_c0_g1_i4:130-972(-)